MKANRRESYSIVIDTDSFAPAFAHQLGAFLTGGVGGQKVRSFGSFIMDSYGLSKYGIWEEFSGNPFRDLFMAEHTEFESWVAHPTQDLDGHLNSVLFRFVREPTALEVEEIKVWALKFSAMTKARDKYKPFQDMNPVNILGIRLITAITYDTELKVL